MWHHGHCSTIRTLFAIQFLSLNINCTTVHSSPSSTPALKSESPTNVDRGAATTKTSSRRLIFYVERIHDASGAEYQSIVEETFKRLLATSPNPQISLVFWPNAAEDKIHVWDGSQLEAHLQDILDVHFWGRSGTRDYGGFVTGLRFCANLAAKDPSEIVIMSDAITELLGRDGRDVISRVSAKYLVHVVSTGDDSKDFKDIVDCVSGFAVQAMQGRKNSIPEGRHGP